MDYQTILSLVPYSVGGAVVGYVAGTFYSKWRKSMTAKCAKCGVRFKSKEDIGCGRCKSYPTLDEVKGSESPISPEAVKGFSTIVQALAKKHKK